MSCRNPGINPLEKEFHGCIRSITPTTLPTTAIFVNILILLSEYSLASTVRMIILIEKNNPVASGSTEKKEISVSKSENEAKIIKMNVLFEMLMLNFLI